MAALEGGSMEINAAPDIDVESMPRPKITQKEEKPYINVEDKYVQICLYGCELINHSGIMLHCPQSVIGAGQMYFMRFYRREENREKYSPFFMAMTCIYLATKVEEEIRRHRDILTVFDRILKKRELKGPKRGEFMALDPSGTRYKVWKDYLQKLELILLKELGYRYLIRLPHNYILQYIPFLELGQKIVEPAWSIVNDSLHIPLLIDVSPNAIAAASLYLASQRDKIDLPHNWFCRIEVAIEDIKYVAEVISELYTIPKSKYDKYPDQVHPDEPHPHIDAIPRPTIPVKKKKKQEKGSGAQADTKTVKKKNTQADTKTVKKTNNEEEFLSLKKEVDEKRKGKKEVTEKESRKRRRRSASPRERKKRKYSASTSKSRSRSRDRRRRRERRRRDREKRKKSGGRERRPK